MLLLENRQVSILLFYFLLFFSPGCCFVVLILLLCADSGGGGGGRRRRFCVGILHVSNHPFPRASSQYTHLVMPYGSKPARREKIATFSSRGQQAVLKRFFFFSFSVCSTECGPGFILGERQKTVRVCRSKDSAPQQCGTEKSTLIFEPLPRRYLNHQALSLFLRPQHLPVYRFAALSG